MCQLLVRVGKRSQYLGGKAGKMLAQNTRTVAILFGKDDIDAQCQRLSCLNLVDQLGDQIARPRPLTIFHQALAIDADDDHRFPVSFTGHQALIMIELCLSYAEER